ncbi:MAG: DUF899 family protein [Acidimicrobiales bacterium]|nr:DUF899 family protein [Acidimicrobiales bacterium]
MDASRGYDEYNFRTLDEYAATGQESMKTSEQAYDMPGQSCFLRVGGRVFHTYSMYARGLEALGGSYYFLDNTALGRQEDWEEPKGRSDDSRGNTPDFASSSARGSCRQASVAWAPPGGEGIPEAGERPAGILGAGAARRGQGHHGHAVDRAAAGLREPRPQRVGDLLRRSDRRRPGHPVRHRCRDRRHRGLPLRRALSPAGPTPSSLRCRTRFG